MENGKIRLSLIQREDLEGIIRWNTAMSADDLLQWTGPAFRYPLTLPQIENEFLNDRDPQGADHRVYKVQLLPSCKRVGIIELKDADKENKIGKVCRFLIGEEKNRGKGLGHMILQEIFRIGFEDRNYETIMLGVFDFNQGAIHCYEHVGFAKETFLKNARKSSTGYWNLYEMEISKQKWLGMKV